MDPDPATRLVWIYTSSDPQPCLKQYGMLSFFMLIPDSLKMCCNFQTHPASKITIIGLAHNVLTYLQAVLGLLWMIRYVMVRYRTYDRANRPCKCCFDKTFHIFISGSTVVISTGYPFLFPTIPTANGNFGFGIQEHIDLGIKWVNSSIICIISSDYVLGNKVSVRRSVVRYRVCRKPRTNMYCIGHRESIPPPSPECLGGRELSKDFTD